jgi:nucleotide-binding universal stress UspA family protein
MTTAPKRTKSPKKKAMALQKILVPVDFSPASEKALQYGLSLAAQFSSEILLMHVVEAPFYPTELGYVPVEVESLNKGIKQAAEKEMARWSQEHVPADVEVQTLIRVGHPYQEITQAARKLGADLIVVSTHGYTGLKHVFLGSTAERIVRHAGCPVLVVRENEKDFV